MMFLGLPSCASCSRIVAKSVSVSAVVLFGLEPLGVEVFSIWERDWRTFSGASGRTSGDCPGAVCSGSANVHRPSRPGAALGRLRGRQGRVHGVVPARTIISPAVVSRYRLVRQRLAFWRLSKSPSRSRMARYRRIWRSPYRAGSRPAFLARRPAMVAWLSQASPVRRE